MFKPVLAAAALEAGEGDFIRECPGYDVLNGQVYRCAGSVPHGLVGLDGALEKSCNGYFIELGRELGPERVRKMAAALGFGKGQDIADGLRSASGVLPEAETLENEGQFANFCFGQGGLLATPLQVAGMMNTIAAGGVYHTPLFVECTVDETTGEELTPLAHSSPSGCSRSRRRKSCKSCCRASWQRERASRPPPPRGLPPERPAPPRPASSGMAKS